MKKKHSTKPLPHPRASSPALPAVEKLYACEVTLPIWCRKTQEQHIMTDVDFQSGDSGASSTYPQQCSALRKNGYVMIKERPCKIVEMSTSKTGKHGHAKVHLVGIDVFTQKKLEDICPSTHNMDVPNVTRKDYQVIDVSEGYLSLMDDGGNTREDLKLPDNELGKEIEKRFDNGETFMVSVLKALDEEMVVGTKVVS
ncbi:hypothetical protein PFLUV_G00231150 [Perca fluviatilis]|uniref:Translation initiation factor 5A C-terminal domain-containing protein n=2 Tax=Percidae TaxID=8165 RepID=A0A6A5EEZ4_PERFL|nr:hypothetical protein PFLUV_G00231150 [Perca fluviatilis]